MWLIAATALLLGLIACGGVILPDQPIDGLVALQTASTIVSLTLLLLSVGFDRSIYADVAVVVSALSFAQGMVFVRFLERAA